MDKQEKLYFYNLAIDFFRHTKDPEIWNLYVRNKEFGIQFRRCDALKILKALTNEGYIESLGKTDKEIDEFIGSNGPIALENLIYNGSIVVASTSKNDYSSKTFKDVIGITKLNLDGSVDIENMFTYILYVDKSKGQEESEEKQQ